MTQSEIQRELLLVERRLGTSAELPDDLEHARRLAHTLGNLVAVDWLRSEVEQNGTTSNSIAALD